jgi:hypothetical protein
MSKLKDIFFPMAKSLEALEQIDDLERIKRNNYELAEKLKREELNKNAQEEMDRDYPMKRFSIEVVSGGVVLPYTIEARGFDYSGSGTYYFYRYKIGSHGYKEREIIAHFPIGKTIIKSIEVK